MVKRYDFEIDGCGGCDMCGVTAEECATGDYVLYDDYDHLRRKANLLLEVQVNLMDALAEAGIDYKVWGNKV